MECNHEKVKKVSLKREFKGMLFKYKTDECLKCGSKAWSSQHQIAFMQWIDELPDNVKEKCTLQRFKLSDASWEVVGWLQKEFGASYASSIVKAAALVYVDYISMDHRLMDAIEADFREIERTYDIDKTKNNSFSVRVSPAFYLRMQANAELSEMEVKQFIQEASERVLLALSKSEPFKEHLSEIKRRLEQLVLMAA